MIKQIYLLFIFLCMTINAHAEIGLHIKNIPFETGADVQGTQRHLHQDVSLSTHSLIMDVSDFIVKYSLLFICTMLIGGILFLWYSEYRNKNKAIDKNNI